MENLVVTLATGKKLKAAGFPQTAVCRWVQNKVNGEWDVRVDKGINYVGFAAPSAQEIADQLEPAMFIEEAGYNGLLTIKHGPRGINGQKQTGALAWGACYFVGGASHEPIGMANSLVEALAALWLALREAK